MPFRRRSNFRRNRKPYRRSRKGNSRGRFARKRFSKSVPRGLKAGLYIPRQAFVKLPFTQIIQGPALTAGANYNLGIHGNGICCPLSQLSLPVPGEVYPIGVDQYANFYQHYRVLGASIKVQINSSTTISGDSVASQQASYYCALTAAQGKAYDGDPSSNWYKLSNASTQDVISYPGTSWRLMSQSVGSRQNIFLKRFGKTKSIIGVKDIRDNEETLCQLPRTNQSVAEFVNGTNPNSVDSSWFFILRIDPNLSVNIPANSFQIVLKVKYYVQLTGRDYNNQAVVPTP